MAATSAEDLALLERVVSTLQRVRNTSRPSERLYTVCATFSRLARRLIEARGNVVAGVGVYDQREDLLRMDGASFGDAFSFDFADVGASVDMVDFEGGRVDGFVEAGELSALLGEWADGQASANIDLGIGFRQQLYRAGLY